MGLPALASVGCATYVYIYIIVGGPHHARGPHSATPNKIAKKRTKKNKYGLDCEQDGRLECVRLKPRPSQIVKTGRFW